MSDAAAAPAKKAAPKKPKVAPAHPPVAEMVTAAITALKDRKGSSLAAIKKYVAGNYKVDMDRIAPFIRRSWRLPSRRVLSSKPRVRVPLAPSSWASSPNPKKEKVAKKPKAVAKKPKTPKKAAKKPAAKKAVKKTPKKAAKKPKAASGKKPKAAAKPKKTVAKKPKAAAKKSPKKAAKLRSLQEVSGLLTPVDLHPHSPKGPYQGPPNPPKRAFTWHAIVSLLIRLGS